MTIYCYEGLPGSGKSYDATRKLLDHLAKGRRIITNIDGVQNEQQMTTIKHYLDLSDNQLAEQLIYIDSEQVLSFWDHVTPGDLIVIDEAQNFFNSRDWQSGANREFGKWASEHRKRGNDLILITQAMEGIESSVRRLVEWVYRYKKLNMFGSGINKKYMRFAYYGQSLDPLGKTICTYDTKIFKCYSSYFVSGTEEIGVEKPFNVFKHPIFYSIPVLLGIFIYFFSNSSIVTGDLFGTGAIVEDTLAQQDSKISPPPLVDPAAEALPGSDQPGEVLEKKTITLGFVNGKEIILDENGSIILL